MLPNGADRRSVGLAERNTLTETVEVVDCTLTDGWVVAGSGHLFFKLFYPSVDSWTAYA